VGRRLGGSRSVVVRGIIWWVWWRSGEDVVSWAVQRGEKVLSGADTRIVVRARLETLEQTWCFGLLVISILDESVSNVSLHKFQVVDDVIWK